ncbi:MULTISPECIES: hypothetical protein [Streptomyces]|uniref:DUF4240 domain-containing protein n=1 Tax=Streptomyces clavifer TaxID=68188 RepID=A0ABS4V7C7_9ACTN|nr:MULTISPECIES: hypothetical protein [Streptomyces]MBP2359812.1 hypothetical protein [Streptomyces clavifer]MDX2746640.1 hypothetical protein [Streptomyces sp. NRRL_B-2557]WRY83513.1 hypothetical protein OG388_20955 [Streptomyces clavifer]WUC29259.1 hypothetical protein OG927_18790 [Streptomyces clavifer]GHB16651.1 hypothetical protein GCM10010392_51400 [Streptomyces clavifer]
MDDAAAIPVPDRDDENFWSTVTTLVEPPWSEPTDDDTFTMDDKVLEAARALAERISTRALAYRTAGKPFDAALMASPDVQLALLRSLHETRRSVDRLAESAATVAGRNGANYTQLGAAWGGIKRQSARLKWPYAVVKKSAGESVPLRYAGGSAVIHHDPDADAWWYTATAADQREEESEAVHPTSAEAIARATEFLLTHPLPGRPAPA